MNIGEEEEAKEYPMPLAPGQNPVHEPSPQVEPVAVPVPEKVGARSEWPGGTLWEEESGNG